MRIRNKALAVLAAASVALSMGLATAGSANAGSKWFDFGPGTGVQSVFYNDYTSDFSRAGSGIVHQWIAPGGIGGAHGLYYLYKPITTGSVFTPFQQSCDMLGQVSDGGFPRLWPGYSDSAIVPTYFKAGVQYFTCQYYLSNWASGAVNYNLLGLNRNVTFDVQMPQGSFPGGGTMNYFDGTTAYSVVVDAVYISGNTATFSGFYPTGSTTQWIVLQAVNNGGVLSWGGDVVTVDPSGTLSTFVPTLNGTEVTGNITIYTR